MIPFENISCRIPSSDAIKETVINCSTSATNAPELWSSVGTCAAAVFAAAAAFISFRSVKADEARHRRQEVRDATAALIRSINTLFARSADPSRDNNADRVETYQQSVLFELAAGPHLDRDRFNAAINWVLKASKLRFDEEINSTPNRRSSIQFLGSLVHQMTEALREYDLHGGKVDPSPDIAQRFSDVFDKPLHARNMQIYRALNLASTSDHDSYYERLVLRGLPEFVEE
ncbi:hypothetical protein [Glutamicibacter sp. X7]